MKLVAAGTPFFMMHSSAFHQGDHPIAGFLPCTYVYSHPIMSAKSLCFSSSLKYQKLVFLCFENEDNQVDEKHCYLIVADVVTRSVHSYDHQDRRVEIEAVVEALNAHFISPKESNIRSHAENSLRESIGKNEYSVGSCHIVPKVPLDYNYSCGIVACMVFKNLVKNTSLQDVNTVQLDSFKEEICQTLELPFLQKFLNISSSDRISGGFLYGEKLD